MEYRPILEHAQNIAERASEIALSFFRQAILIEMKENKTPVTIADKKAEEMIRKELERHFPKFGILGEEFGESAPDAEYVWTIDPIDGTRSFIRGIPLFGTLLGLLHHKEPVLGVMVLPALRETYTSAKGLGAFCNGTRIHVSSAKSVDQALISVGDISWFDQAGKGKVLDSILRKVDVCRGYTDCFGHSLVMRGALDAMLDPIVAPWDVIPLASLISEAGGDYFDFDGGKTFDKSFVSCAPGLRDHLLKFTRGV